MKPRLSASTQSQSVGTTLRLAQARRGCRCRRRAAPAALRQHFPNSKITIGAIELCFGLLQLYSVVNAIFRFEDTTKFWCVIMILTQAIVLLGTLVSFSVDLLLPQYVVNPPERKLAKRTSVYWCYLSIPLFPFEKTSKEKFKPSCFIPFIFNKGKEKIMSSL